MTLEDAKTYLLSRILVVNECWEWQGSVRSERSPYGACQATINGYRYWVAHRLAYGLFKDINFNKEMYVCHHCDNPKCVNPDHLFLGTAKDNHDDMWAKKRSKYHKNPTEWVGSNNWQSKLSKRNVTDIRKMGMKKSILHTTIAKKYGICREQVHLILLNKSRHDPKFNPDTVRRKYTNEERFGIFQEFEKGSNLKDLAFKYNRTRSAIYYIVKKFKTQVPL